MIIHGNNVILASVTTGVAFGAAKSCELDVQADTMETSTPSDGGWKTYLVGRKSWNMSLSHLVEGVKTNAMTVGQVITVQFGIRGSDSVLQGTAIIESWKVTATRGNLAQGSFKLKGSGPLTIVSVE